MPSVKDNSDKTFQKRVYFNQHRLTREPQTHLLMIQIHFRLICGEFTMITTFMRQFSKSCNGWQKVHLWGKPIYSSTWKRFQNRSEWSTCFHGAFSLWCRNIKAFCENLFALQRQQPKKHKQNVHVVPSWKKSATSIATFTLSTSFDVWASQAKLTMYEIGN